MLSLLVSVLVPTLMHALLIPAVLSVLFRLPYARWGAVMSLGVSLLFRLLIMLLFERGNYIFTLSGVVLPFMLVYAAFRIRGMRFLAVGLTGFIVTLLVDVYGSVLLSVLFGPEGFEALRAVDNVPGLVICNTLPYTLILLIMGGTALFRTLRSRWNDRWTLALRIIRPILLSLVTLGVYMLVMERITALSIQDAMAEMMLCYALCIVLLGVSISYAVQDIRQFRQARRMETLEQEHRINQALLTDLRTFRHNIANMLYGLDGVLLSGTREDVRRYYDEIIHRCAMINNDNIVMLRNVHAPAVTALLLRHIDLADKAHIPLVLYVEKGVRLGRMPVTRLCEVLGVLIDNAREAAALSPAPRMGVEIRQVQGGTEIIVRNTYNASGGLPSFTSSTKAGHEGVGLSGVRKALERHPRCYLNLHTQGRYVEAQLLLDA